jgi:prepilin-type N-terminal cleavage/methylation domain-containing protein
MTAFRQTIQKPLKNKKGFTLLEVVIVSVMLSILSSIAIYNYIPLRKKALDTTALSDARNLVQSVVDATLSEEDVDYTKINTGGAVGDVDTGGNPRTPVFVLSPGVEVVIIGSSNELPNGDTVFSAIVYHTSGTSDLTTLSGKKEYTCSVDESTGVTSLP